MEKKVIVRKVIKEGKCQKGKERKAAGNLDKGKGSGGKEKRERRQKS